MQRKRLHRLGVVATAAGAFAVMVSGVAVAVHDAQTIHACANKHSGALRVVDGADWCNPSESPLAWNEQGAPGADGISGYQVVSHDEPVASQPDLTVVTVPCPSGKRATGGGVVALVLDYVNSGEVVESATNVLSLSNSYPAAGGTAWSVSYVTEPAPGFVGVRVYATCASMS